MAKMYNRANVSASSITAAREPAIEISSVTDETTDVIIKELKEQRSLLECEKSNLLGKLNKLKEQVTKAEEERKTLTQQVKELTEENTALKVSHTQDIEELRQKITKLEEELKKKDEKLTKLEEELKKKDEVMESLQTRINHLEEDPEQKRARSDQNKLYISQAAFQFEQAICTFILPEGFEKDQHATIKSLLKYLHGKSQLPRQIKDPTGKLLFEAKERWDKVCVELNLPTISEEKVQGNFTNWKYDESSTPDTMKAVYFLKQNRLTIAHPKPISLKSAGEKLQSPAVKDSMPSWKFALIESFIASIQRSILEGNGSKIYSKHFQLE